MVELHFCFSFHEILSWFILSDPFSIVVTNSKTEVNNVRIHHFLSFFVDQLNWYVDIPFFVDNSWDISCGLKSIFVILLSEHCFNKRFCRANFFFLGGLSWRELYKLVASFCWFLFFLEIIEVCKEGVESLFAKL